MASGNGGKPLLSNTLTALGLTITGFGSIMHGGIQRPASQGDIVWRNWIIGETADVGTLNAQPATLSGAGTVSGTGFQIFGAGALVANGVTFSANFAQHSQAFDNAVWFKTNSAITANYTNAPDGTLTADMLNDTAASFSHLVAQSQNFFAAVEYTFSVYVKRGAGDWVRLTNNAGGNSHVANFNVTLGTIGYTDLYGGSARIENVGDGWFRCSVTPPVVPAGAGGVGSISVYLMAGDTTSAVYAGVGWTKHLWGAQLENGPAPTPYIPAAASVVSAPIPALFGSGYTAAGSIAGTGALNADSAAVAGVGTVSGAVVGITGSGVLLANYGVAVPAGATAHVNFFQAPSGFVAGTGAVGIETLIGYDPVLDPNFITGYNPAFISQYGYDYAEPTGDGITVPAFIGALRTAAVGGGSIVIKFQSRPDDGLGYALEDFAASIATADLIRQIWVESFDGYVAAGSHQSMDQMEAVWTYSPAGGHINALGFTVRPSSKFEWAANNTGVISFPLTDTDTPPANPMVAVYIDAFGPIASITAYPLLSTADLKAKTAPALDGLYSPVSGVGTVQTIAVGALAAGPATLAGTASMVSIATGALAAGAAALAGLGVAQDRVTGTGALAAGSAALAGTGAALDVIVGEGAAVDIVNLTGSRQQGTFGATAPTGALGQSFTAISNKITSITPWVAKAGAPIDSMVLKLYAATGDLPNTGVLLGTAPSVLGSSLAAGTAAPLEFAFSSPIPVTNGVKYVYTLERTGAADGNGFYVYGYFNPANYAGGAFSQRSSGTWTAYPLDSVFTISHSARGLKAADSALSGSGVVIAGNYGVLVAQPSALSGAGTVSHQAAGALAAQPSALAGIGSARTIATGALVSGPATLAGAVTVITNASGSLAAGPATLSGIGQAVVPAGTGDLVSGPATLAGVGGLSAAPAVGLGELAAGPASLAGAGTVTTITRAAVALVAGPAALDGVGTAVKLATGTGALVAANDAISGVGYVTDGGAGVLIAGTATLFGVGTVSTVIRKFDKQPGPMEFGRVVYLRRW